MYRSLVVALFCIAAQAAPAAQDKPQVPPSARPASAPAELIKSASAGTRVEAGLPRDKPPAAAAPAEQPSHKPATRDMVLAALALMVGIAVRRYGVGRQ